MPLLSKEQEQHLFRKMNFLKHQAAKLRDRTWTRRRRHAPRTSSRSRTCRNRPTPSRNSSSSCNMRLVVSIAKRHAAQTDNFFELLSDGNMSLIRAVEKFDYSRGNKFSTYASWAIMKNFARSIPEEKHRRERYVTGHEELFEAAPDTPHRRAGDAWPRRSRPPHRVNRLLEYLDPREREIIRMRAGLDNYPEGMTLEEIGQTARHHQGTGPPAERPHHEQAEEPGPRPARGFAVKQCPNYQPERERGVEARDASTPRSRLGLVVPPASLR